MALLETTTREVGRMADGTPLTVTVTAEEKRALLFGVKR